MPFWVRKIPWNKPESPALTGAFFITEPPGKPSHEPTVGQNHLPQSLFYNKVLTSSCNLLTTTPREGNGSPLQYLAWRFPWTEEPGGLQSMGLHRVGRDNAAEHVHKHIECENQNGCLGTDGFKCIWPVLL